MAIIYVTDKEYQADIKISLISQEYKADVKVFKVNQEYKAKWKKSNPWISRLG